MQRIRFRVGDLAELAGISTRQVWREVKAGKLPPPHIDGRAGFWGFDDPEVVAWLADRGARQIGERTWQGAREQTAGAQSMPLHPYFSPPELATIEDLAIILDKSERSIWRMVKEGSLPPPEPVPLRPRLWKTTDALDWWDRWLRRYGTRVVPTGWPHVAASPKI